MAKVVKGFRLDNTLLDELNEKAQRNGTNLNNFVGSILTTYNSEHDYYITSKYLLQSPKVIEYLISKCDDSDMIKLAKIYSTDIKNKILYTYSELLLPNILSELQNFFKLQGQDFSVTHNDPFHKYTIIHQINARWGYFLSLIITNLLKIIKIKLYSLKYNSKFLTFLIQNT